MEGVEGHELVSHTWYADADRKGRRISLRVHPERRHISLSLWDGNSCRATYHLSLSDVPDLIRDLAAGLAEAAKPGPGSANPVAPGSVPRAGRRDDPIGKTAQLAVSALRKGARLLEPYTRTGAASSAPEETTVLKLFADPDKENPPS